MEKQRKSNKPNLLIILTDQQRADTIEPSSPCLTPNIDQLSKDGVRFTRAYTPNAICSPARASLMTGRFPSRHGMVDCTHTVEPYRANLNEGTPMWSQHLSRSGYTGGYFGKWHVERSNNLAQFGFDIFVDADSAQYQHYREKMGFNERVMETNGTLKHKGYKDFMLYGVYDEPVEATEPYFLYSQGIDFIREQVSAQQPWFTVISTYEPHDPYLALKSSYEHYQKANIQLPPSYRELLTNKPSIQKRLQSVWNDMSEQQAREAMACYYATISQIDDQVGRLTDALREMNQLDKTIIIYTSDHGDLLSSHGLFLKGVPAYEDVYKVPMVISGSCVNQPGRTSDACVSLVDLAQTITDLCGIEQIEDMDGRCLTPLLKSENENMDNWDSMYAEFHGQRFFYTQRIVWNDKYKYIFNGFDIDELYDLHEDPHEMNNLAQNEQYRDVLEDMAIRMWENVRKLGDHNMEKSDYGMFRFAPVGPMYNRLEEE